MSGFDFCIGIDWSGAVPARGIAAAEVSNGVARPIAPPSRHWSRGEIVEALAQRIEGGERLLVGIDCSLCLPWVPGEGYLDGRVPEIADLFQLWDLVEEAAQGAPDLSGGPVVADARFAASFWISGPRPAGWKEHPGKLRQAEIAALRGGHGQPVSVFHLAAGARQVGKASLAGMRAARALKRRLGDRLRVWPAESVAPGTSVIAEAFPTLFRRRSGAGTAKIRSASVLMDSLARLGCRAAPGLPATFDDHLGDAMILAAGLFQLSADPAIWHPSGLPPELARREAWIFGVPA